MESEKGERKKQLNETQRNLVLDLVNQGKSYRTVGEIMKVSFTTVSAIVKKFKNFGTTKDLEGKGRKRKTSTATDR